jgi:hypothetical protein
MERRRIELFENVNINSFTTAAERYAFAEKIINELKSKLNNGWTIFNDTEAFVYENQTMYSNFARVYKRTVESNMTVNFWISKYISEELKQSGLSKNTVETYISCCRVFNMWIDANRYSRLDITAINNPHIIEFFTYLGENNF